MLPLVVRVEDSQTRRATTYTFQTSPVHVGRSELNDLSLPQGFVSLWHAIFWFDDQKVQCADLGSTNGTQLDGGPLEKGVRTELTSRARLSIGTLEITFSRELPAGEVPGSQVVKRQTLFGTRVGSQPGSTMALDPSALILPRAEVGTASAVTILHEGPLPFTGVGAPSERTPIHGAPPPVEAKPKVATPPPAANPPTEAMLQLVSHIAAPYLDFRHAWRTLLERLRQGFASLPEPDRAQAAALLQNRFPTLVQEEEYRQLVRSVPGAAVPEAIAGWPATPVPVHAPVSPPPPATGAGESAAAQLLEQFAHSYAPNVRALTTRGDVEGFLDRLAALIETFANAFVELRKGKDQFEKEVGVPTSGSKGPLQRARNVEEVLRYLLDITDPHARKPEELIRGFAEVMIHHVALLNGIREGAKGLLAQLSPAALSKPGRTERPSGFQKLLEAVFPTVVRWRRFVDRRQGLLEEETQLTAVLFGPEFARAYTAVASDTMDAEDKR